MIASIKLEGRRNFSISKEEEGMNEAVTAERNTQKLLSVITYPKKALRTMRTPVSFPFLNRRLLIELKKLSECESGIQLRKNCQCDLKLNYSVLPVNSKKFRAAVSEELNKRVLKYNSDLNDMVLKYSNIRVKTPIEATRSRKLTVLCIADIYVFKPQHETILTATVNKKSKNHIGCLMYNIFNVSIIKPPDLPYNHWPGRHIEVHDTVTFKVTKVDVSEVIPYIIGELVPNENDDAIKENDERDSVISTDHNSLITSEDYSDLEDVLETINETKPKKRKLSDKFQEETTPKKRRLK